MIDGHSVSLVMPCRNESGHLADLIEEIPDFYDEIICVSNKSTDETVQVGRQIEKKNKKFRLLIDNRSAKGIGYGFAHMTGIAAAKNEYIVCADSDGTYPIEVFPQILEHMNVRNLSFVSGSRYPDKEIPPKLQLGVKILNCEIALLYWFRIHDSLSGMWVFRRDIVPELHLTEGDWNLSPQIKLNAHKYLGKQFAEIKIKQKHRHGETKQSYFNTGMKHLIWIAKNRFIEPRNVQHAD